MHQLMHHYEISKIYLFLKVLKVSFSGYFEQINYNVNRKTFDRNFYAIKNILIFHITFVFSLFHFLILYTQKIYIISMYARIKFCYIFDIGLNRSINFYLIERKRKKKVVD